MFNKNKTFVDRYYFFPWYLNLLLLFVYIFGIGSSPLYTSILQYQNIKADKFDGTVVPIDYVPQYLAMSENGRKKTYSELPSEVFVKIPEYDSKILARDISDQKAGDEEYEETLFQRVIYTVPYMGNYDFTYEEYVGSHLGVDIKSPIGTPVKNIANGVVVKTGVQPTGFGNFVVIRHDDIVLSNGEVQDIYVLYGHLDEIYAKEGKKISKGSLVGAVGNSGMSFGSHLHFQIDIAASPFHPYRPFTGKEASDAGVNFIDAINIGLGKENALKYTIHPTRFVFDNLDSKFIVQEDEEDFIVATNEEDTVIEEEEVDLSSAPEEVVISEEVINEEEKIVEEVVESNIPENTEELVEEENKTEIEIVEIVKEDKVEVVKEDIIEYDDELISLGNDNLILGDSEEIALIGGVEDFININTDLLIEKSEPVEEEVAIVEETKEEEQIFCTMEYNPVCGEDGKTYSNSCVAEQLNKVIVVSEGECNSEENVPEEVKLFADVDSDSEYYEAIKYLKGLGILNGFSDNTIRVNSTITRAEVLKIIILATGREKNNDEENYFNDILMKSWERGYINKGVDLGLISTDNKLFYPNRSINRVEGLKMILNAAEVDVSTYTETESKYNDVNTNDWFNKYINYSVENNLFNVDGSNFGIETALLRGEVFEMIYKMLK